MSLTLEIKDTKSIKDEKVPYLFSHESQSIEYNLIPLKFHFFDVITAYKKMYIYLFYFCHRLKTLSSFTLCLFCLIYVLQFLMQYKFQLMSSTFISICSLLLQLPFFPFLISLKCSKREDEWNKLLKYLNKVFFSISIQIFDYDECTDSAAVEVRILFSNVMHYDCIS